MLLVGNETKRFGVLIELRSKRRLLMKRTVCTLLAGALIFGVAGCNGANSAEPTVSEASQEETTTTEEETTTTEETTTETTVDETVTKLDMTIDEVVDSLFDETGLTRGTIADYGNDAEGIWFSEDDPNRWDDLYCESIYEDFGDDVAECRGLYANYEDYCESIIILEFDIETDFYKELAVGDKIYFTQVISWPDDDPDETEMSYKIAAINGQYALILIDYSTGEGIFSAPFNKEELQNVYDSFISLK